MEVIRSASTDAGFAQARALFEEYAAGLGVDLCFQGFARELDTLSAMYGPPRGVLLLADMEGEPTGCAAVRPLDDVTCELKRVYVRADFRGNGLGRRLTETALQAARKLGYARIRLDTLPEMAAAQRLYENLGFRDIPAYYGKPMPGQRFMEAVLFSMGPVTGQTVFSEPLHPVEIRVLGSLLEKEVTTPEYYPLTLNALVNACNQKSSRDPVVNYEEEAVQQALALLRHKGLATRISGAGHRVEKYGHSLGERLNLGRRESAVLCVLMLRGPQTAGELRGRTERMHEFTEIADVEHCLESLAARTPEPLVASMPRGRWCHLLGGVPDPAHEAAEPRAAGAAASDFGERIAALEREVAELKQTLESFRRQFE